MMRQEINLYQFFKEPTTKRQFLTWLRFWQINLVFALLCLLAYFFSLWNLNHLNTKKNILESEVKNLEAVFVQNRQRFPALFFEQNFTETVEKIQQELLLQERMLSNIFSQAVFSQNMQALAQNVVPNVWLTSIDIANNGANIILQGKSTNKASLQQFLSNLIKEKIFGDFILNVKNIEPLSDKQTDIINFEVDLMKKTP